MRLLREGDRIRLKVPLLTGWRGLGVVAADQRTPMDLVEFHPDGEPRGDAAPCVACRREVALLLEQGALRAPVLDAG